MKNLRSLFVVLVLFAIMSCNKDIQRTPDPQVYDWIETYMVNGFSFKGIHDEEPTEIDHPGEDIVIYINRDYKHIRIVQSDTKHIFNISVYGGYEAIDFNDDYYYIEYNGIDQKNGDPVTIMEYITKDDDVLWCVRFITKHGDLWYTLMDIPD